MTEIKKLSEKVDELSCLCEEVSKLKELHDTRMKSCASPASSLLPQFDNYHYFDGNVQRRARRIFRCRDCERADIQFCNHCFLCGCTHHRKSECSLKSKKQVATVHEGGGGDEKAMEYIPCVCCVYVEFLVEAMLMVALHKIPIISVLSLYLCLVKL